MTTTIRHARREVAIGLHVDKRVGEAEFFRRQSHSLLEVVEAMSFPIDYVEGYDPDEITAMLRACANVSRARVERLAEEDVLAMVNEGMV